MCAGLWFQSLALHTRQGGISGLSSSVCCPGHCQIFFKSGILESLVRSNRTTDERGRIDCENE